MPTSGGKTTGLEPHPCVVYLLTLSLEEEAVFIRGVTQEEEEEEVVVVFTRENRGGSAQHAEEEVVVFSRENRGGSAQYATRATPIRSSHGPMRA